MTFDVARRIVTTGLGLWAAYALSRQCRKPTGWLGRRLARSMNISHARVTSWGLGHVTIDPRARILDVGCGGGRTIRRMASIATDGHVDGVDYSPASVATAQNTNADLIQSGRVSVQQASVSQLPFADASFDFVTAVETHYYWPNLPGDLREVRRVLTPNGRFLIIAETYRGRRMDWLYRPVMRLLLRATYLSLNEHHAALAEAGFVDVVVDDDWRHGWMCAVGTRPA
jgi:ubiquinone/menaquinone biosynthesis C-methylase UbiE